MIFGFGGDDFGFIWWLLRKFEMMMERNLEKVKVKKK